ncbi:Na+/H+ antiporter NhaC [Deinococcus sp. SL84]|uniref:Na+/H+ antiporter NhaC n=1 Tax=Deinococcus sp. SL84 TaxID=2994663 RepID=UPI002274394A|nr:Na+/H+ antiporter NhaC [Deinococcus sp. SL84]MCY1701575.1 Na+/H+ antiporter NhaC [Deinococcus sp. SL84]
MTETAPRRLPSLGLALIPVVLTLLILGLQIFYYGDFAPHIPLAIGIALTGLLGNHLGISWADVREGIFHVIHVSMPSLAILMVVGMLIGIWIGAGTVPTLIYYGLNILSPQIFLAAAMMICAVISVSLGTSWGTVGTVGLALVGIGAGFGIPLVWTAGAVVSGAFFGDKLSPLSDTTNLAPAVTGITVFDHIKNMLPTTIPAMLIALAIYVVAGFNMVQGEQQVSFESIENITGALQANFVISPLTLLPVLVVLAMALLKKPPLPSLFLGAVVGGIVAMALQGAGLHDVFEYAQNGFAIESGNAEIDSLLNRGGIQSMMWTISLMLLALGFGGALERTGVLESIINSIVRRIKRFGALQASAVGTAFATNVVAGDPYLSIALPGRMFAPVYRGLGYSTKNLARAVEEGGTLMSPLIPWNAGGAFVITALGLGIMDGRMEDLMYIPLSFACWISPLLGILYGFTGLFSPKATAAEQAQWAEQGEYVKDVELGQPA